LQTAGRHDSFVPSPLAGEGPEEHSDEGDGGAPPRRHDSPHRAGSGSRFAGIGSGSRSGSGSGPVTGSGSTMITRLCSPMSIVRLRSSATLPPPATSLQYCSPPCRPSEAVPAPGRRRVRRSSRDRR